MQRLVTIKTFTFPHEAYVVRGKLESEGIYTFLKDEMTVQVHNFYSNAVGGVKLQVPKEEVDRALSIIGETREEPDQVVVLSKKDIKTMAACPFCQSENINRKRKTNWLTWLPFLFVCFDCGKEWRIKR